MPEFEMTPPPRNAQNRRGQYNSPVSQTIDYYPQRRPEYLNAPPTILPAVRPKTRKTFWQRLVEKFAPWLAARSNSRPLDEGCSAKTNAGSLSPKNNRQGNSQPPRPQAGPPQEKPRLKQDTSQRRSGSAGQTRPTPQNQPTGKPNRPNGHPPSSSPKNAARTSQTTPRHPPSPPPRLSAKQSGTPPSRLPSPSQNSQPQKPSKSN